MYIPMIIHQNSVDYNKWLKRLDTKLNEPTNQNSTKVTIVVIDLKSYYITLRTSGINTPMSPTSLIISSLFFALYYELGGS